MSKTELFEKDVEILKRLVERFQREGWQVECANGRYHIKGKDATLSICFNEKTKTVECEYLGKSWNAKLYREYGEEVYTDLEVDLGGGIYVSFKSGEEKVVEVERGGKVILLPKAFYEAYTIHTLVWGEELFERIRFPEPFLDFFRTAHREAKSLVKGFRIREMPEEAFIVNKLIWRAIVEIERHGRMTPDAFPFYNPYVYPFGENGILRVEEAESGLKIVYREYDYAEHITVDEFTWTIGYDGTIKKEEKIESGKGVAYAEKIDKALAEWCQPAIGYFVELSKKARSRRSFHQRMH